MSADRTSYASSHRSSVAKGSLMSARLDATARREAC
jgi:hypothetical protein